MGHGEELLHAFHNGAEDLEANRAGVLSERQMRRLIRSGYWSLLGSAVIALLLGAILYWVAPKPLGVIQCVLAAGLALAALILGAVIFRRTRASVAVGRVECLTGPVLVSMRRAGTHGWAGWYLTVSGRSFKFPVQFWHVRSGAPYRVYFAPGIDRIVAMETEGWG